MTPDDDDRRDERLAQLLDVPPLDDVTRRRLVRRALDEPDVAPGRHRRRRLVAVAAAAAVLVGGVLVTAALLRDDGSDTTTADRDRTEKTDEPAAGAADEEAAAVPPYVGDIGEISNPAVLRERLVERTAAPQSPTESGFAPSRCALPDDGRPVAAVATGTDEGVPVLIHVAPEDGVDTAFVFHQETCELRARVPLV